MNVQQHDAQPTLTPPQVELSEAAQAIKDRIETARNAREMSGGKKHLQPTIIQMIIKNEITQQEADVLVAKLAARQESLRPQVDPDEPPALFEMQTLDTTPQPVAPNGSVQAYTEKAWEGYDYAQRRSGEYVDQD